MARAEVLSSDNTRNDKPSGPPENVPIGKPIWLLRVPIRVWEGFNRRTRNWETTTILDADPTDLSKREQEEYDQVIEALSPLGSKEKEGQIENENSRPVYTVIRNVGIIVTLASIGFAIENHRQWKDFRIPYQFAKDRIKEAFEKKNGKPQE